MRRYLVINQKTGEKRVILVALGENPNSQLKADEKILSVVGHI